MEIKDASAQNVTPQELVEFFVGNNVSPSCPTCGNDHSAIQVDNDQTYVRIMAHEYVALQAEPKQFARVVNMMYPTVMTTCERCGFIRTFSLHRVNVWLNAQNPGREVSP